MSRDKAAANEERHISEVGVSPLTRVQSDGTGSVLQPSPTRGEGCVGVLHSHRKDPSLLVGEGGRGLQRVAG
jgi:hypothetical protein